MKFLMKFTDLWAQVRHILGTDGHKALDQRTTDQAKELAIHYLYSKIILLRFHSMVGVRGFEPPTPTSRT